MATCKKNSKAKKDDTELPDNSKLLKNMLLSVYVRENISIVHKSMKIEDILTQGADVNFKAANDNENTALHTAVSRGEKDIVKLLLNKGAEVQTKNVNGNTPLDIVKNIKTDIGNEIKEILLTSTKILDDMQLENQSVLQNNPKNKSDNINEKQPTYTKRAGTSGVTGQLYETKILSLVMLKASTDLDIQEFYLGTNINGIGAFDDLCFRYKLKNYDKDIMVFLQAKHRDDPENRKLTTNDIRNIAGDFALPKYLDSYLKIKSEFNSKNEDPMFAGDFSNVECNFILYTPSKDMLEDSLKTIKEQSVKVKEFLNTNDVESIFQFNYNAVDVEFLSKFVVEDKIKKLGITLMDFIINNGKFNNMLTDELIKTYHVVLAQKVIDVSSKAPSGMFRNGRFRPDFFYATEEYITILRESCYRELVTTHAKTLKLRKKETKNLLLKMMESPSSSTFSKLFGTVLTHSEKSNKLELIEDNMKSFKLDDIKQFRKYLKDIQFTESILNEAIEMTCKDDLKNKEFKLPNSFGNFDMTIRSGGNKVENSMNTGGKRGKGKKNNDNSASYNVLKETKENYQLEESKSEKENRELIIDESKKEPKDKFNQRLDHLSSKFEILFKKFQETKIIEIDDNIVGQKKLLEEGFLDINGGIGGAVGNLLVMNNESGLLEFNTNTIAETASKLLKKLEDIPENIRLNEVDPIVKENLKLDYEDSKISLKYNITSYKLDVKITGFPRLTFGVNEYDRMLTRDFLNRLWFYTSQAKEDKVESILKEEIDKRYNASRYDNLFRIHSDAIFLRFHDEIQKWWMLSGQVHYLTNESNIFDKVNQFVVDNPLLTIVNAMYSNKLKKIGIEYSNEYVKNLQLDTFLQKVINVVTEVNILSGIKIRQYYKNIKNHTFIDFDYILSLPQNDFDKMISELKVTKMKTLIIFYETPKKIYGVHEKLIQIINDFKELHGSKVIIVTDKILAEEIMIWYSHEYIAINDQHIGLIYLTNKSQTKVLEDAKVIFQGDEVDLLTVIDDDTKHFVKPKILWKLINNENIYIGRKIELSTQTDFGKRKLKLNECYEVDTLSDLEENVVVITAKPGMGKSTLLIHLALQTKAGSSYIWIPIINFYDCSVTFSKWQSNKTITSFEEVFKLICDLVLKNNVCNLKCDVKKDQGKVKLSNIDDIDPLVLFELELFIDFYNKKRIIFLFDDFDDVCPPFDKETFILLNTIKVDSNRLWITSRPYPVPKQVLEREFGQSYTLMPFDKAQQKGFFDRFFKTNIKLEKLNNEQFSNISAFIEYISNKRDIQKGERHTVPFVSIPLHLIYIVAVEFFKSELNNITKVTVRNALKERLQFDIDSFGTLSSLGTDNTPEMEEAMELAGTPLHMYIAANYFKFQINESFKIVVDKTEIRKKWDIITNSITLYKTFLEKTLKGICFQRNIPEDDVEEIKQVKLRREFLERHKKLALLAICKEADLGKLLKKEELDQLKGTIARIKSGEERSGSIDCIMNEVPRFFHLMFAEYFIVEVLVDLLKSISAGDVIDISKHKAVWDFIMNIFLFNCPPSIRKAFNYKLKHDSELQEITCKDYCREIVFELLLKQNDHVHEQPSCSNAPRRYTLNMVIADGLTYVGEFLIKCIKDNLSQRNVRQFIDLIKESEFLKSSLSPQNKVIVDVILNTIKDVDSDKLFDIVFSESFVEVPVRLASLTGDEALVENVRSQLTTARTQLTSGELFGIDRDTANLIGGVFSVFINELRK